LEVEGQVEVIRKKEHAKRRGKEAEFAGIIGVEREREARRIKEACGKGGRRCRNCISHWEGGLDGLKNRAAGGRGG
jgi:hypothetical protein